MIFDEDEDQEEPVPLKRARDIRVSTQPANHDESSEDEDEEDEDSGEDWDAPSTKQKGNSNGSSRGVSAVPSTLPARSRSLRSREKRPNYVDQMEFPVGGKGTKAAATAKKESKVEVIEPSLRREALGLRSKRAVNYREPDSFDFDDEDDGEDSRPTVPLSRRTAVTTTTRPVKKEKQRSSPPAKAISVPGRFLFLPHFMSCLGVLCAHSNPAPPVRFSSRVSTQKRRPNYAESSDEEDEEDAVEENEDGDEDEDEESSESEADPLEEPEEKVVEKLIKARNSPVGEGGKTKREYLVKWKGRSYLHLDWVEASFIEADKFGKAKVQRFEKENAEEGLDIAVDSEELGYDPAFLEIDRILAKTTKGGQTKYLVKWRSQNYSESTWELASDLNDDAAIRLFEQRQVPPSTPAPKTRPPASKWARLEESPVYQNGHTLRPYQLEGLNWLAHCWYQRRSSILADEMGLGKTCQSVSIIEYLYRVENIRGPFLIVAPLSTVNHWKREFEGWTDLNTILYHGPQDSRQLIRQYEWHFTDASGRHVRPDTYKFNVLITTFECALSDRSVLSRIRWKYLIVDEAHRLKNKNSKLLGELRQCKFDHMLLLTGTPLQNNTQELWTLLNFMDPIKFASLEDFLREFGELKEAEQVDKLHNLLRPFLLRRMKEDVEKSIPAKEETLVEVELTPIQKTYYRAIYERNFSFLSKGSTPSLLNVMMELRKCCNHPYLIKGVEQACTASLGPGEDINDTLIRASGKLVLVDKLLPKLKAGGHKVLIFSQMVRVLDILEDFLNYRNYSYERIDGGVRGNDRQAAIDRFSKPGSEKFVFLLCTRAGGLGINLTAADTVIIFDSDWNPQNDLQAQARCHRIGQTEKVKVYRLITRRTYEMEMFKTASRKLGLDKAVLHKMRGVNKLSSNEEEDMPKLNKKEINDLLKHGAYAILGETDDHFYEEDIDQILERNSKLIVHETAETNSTFSKASFVSSDAQESVDLDDPDFWKKVIPVNAQKQKDSRIQEQPRVRKQVQRFIPTDHRSALSDESDDDDYSDDDKRKKAKQSIPWSINERTKCKNALLCFGYGRWAEIKRTAKLERRTEEEVAAFCRFIFRKCVEIAGEDYKDKLESCIVSEDKDKEGQAESDAKVNSRFGSDQKFAEQLLKGGKVILKKLELVAELARVVRTFDGMKNISDFPELDSSNAPVEWWDHESDCHLLLGSYRHGYGRYQSMRTDPTLCFSRRRYDQSKDDEDEEEKIGMMSPLGSPLPAQQPPETAEKKEEKGKESGEAEEKGKQPATEDSREAAHWPAAKVLNKRLKRLLRTYNLQQKKAEKLDGRAKERERKEKRKEELAQEWSKREKQDLYKVFQAFGIPTVDGSEDWEFLRIRANLKRKTHASIAKFCESFLAMAKELSANRKTGDGEDQDNPYIEQLDVRVAHLLKINERIALLEQVRKLSEHGDIRSIASQVRMGSFPTWWSRSHDEALVPGILKYGFGNWDELCKDPEFPFLAIWENQQRQKGKKIPEPFKSSNSKASEARDKENDDSETEEKSEDAKVTYAKDIRFPKDSMIRNRIQLFAEIAARPPIPVSTPLSDGPSDSQPPRKMKQTSISAFAKVKSSKNSKEAKEGTEVAEVAEAAPMAEDPIEDSQEEEAHQSSPESQSNEPPKKSLKRSRDTGSREETGASESIKDPSPPKKLRKAPSTSAVGTSGSLRSSGEKNSKKLIDVAKDEHGNIIFPIKLGPITVLSLGTIVWDRPAYHTDRYILPVGYKASRTLTSYRHPKQKTEYICEILDGGDCPLYRVTPEDDAEHPSMASSPSAAWQTILQRIKDNEGRQATTSVSGPEYFGLSHLTIRRVRFFCSLSSFEFVFSLFPLPVDAGAPMRGLVYQPSTGRSLSRNCRTRACKGIERECPSSSTKETSPAEKVEPR